MGMIAVGTVGAGREIVFPTVRGPWTEARAACIAWRHTETLPEGPAEMRLAGEAVTKGDFTDRPPAIRARRKHRAAAGAPA